jgi:lysophospholipase
MAGSWFQRIIACAPMIALHPERARYPAPVLRLVSEVAALVAPSMYVPGGSDRPEELVPFERNALTSDRERWSRNKAVIDAAPDLALGAPTYGWLRAAMRSCAALQHPDYAVNVHVPLLLFSAGNDRIVSTPAIEDFAVRLKIGTHVTIPASRHEILQETDDVRQRFWAAFDAYLNIESAVV